MNITKMLFRFLSVSLLGLLLFGCAEPPYNNVDNTGLERLIENGVPLVDIRRPDEWRQTGIVPGSERLTFVDASGRLKPDFLSRFTRQYSQNDPVILICRTGNRTDALARHLVEKMGYTQVYNVRDGIMEWLRRGKPIERS